MDEKFAVNTRVGYGESEGTDDAEFVDRFLEILPEVNVYGGTGYAVYPTGGLSAHRYLNQHEEFNVYGGIGGLGARFDTAQGFDLGFDAKYQASFQADNYKVSGNEIKDIRMSSLDF